MDIPQTDTNASNFTALLQQLSAQQQPESQPSPMMQAMSTQGQMTPPSQAPVQQQSPQQDAPIPGLADKIQQWLGATQAPQGGQAQDILSARFQPTLSDVATALGSSLSTGNYTSPEIAAADRLRTISEAARSFALARNGRNGNTPAALQLADEYQKRIAAGDIAGANQIAQFAKIDPSQLAGSSQIIPQPMNPTTATGVAALYPDANPANSGPPSKNPISGKSASDIVPIVLQKDKNGTVTLPATDDDALNPFAGLNGSDAAPSKATNAFVPAQLHGPAFLQTLDPNRAQLVQGLGDAKLNLATITSRMQPEDKAALIADVQRYNPDYMQSGFGAVSKFNIDPKIRGLNVSISHLGTLANLAGQLDNGNIQQFNKAAQGIAEQTGQAAPTNFDAAKLIVGNEVIKTISGAGVGSDTDRQEISDSFSRAKSPQQLSGAIKTAQTLLGGQLSGFSQQYKHATGRSDFNTMLSPETLKILPQDIANNGSIVYGPDNPLISSANANSPVIQKDSPDYKQSVANAKQAVASGVDPKKVATRLQAAGINPADAGL